MQKNKFAIFLFAAVLIVGLVAFVLGMQLKADKFEWTPKLEHDKKQPYDFSLLQELLKSNYSWGRIDGPDFDSKLSTEEDIHGKAYLYAGNYPYYSKKTAETIYNFAKKGGEVFIISHSVPDSLLQCFIDADNCLSDIIYNQLSISLSNKIECSFTHPNFKNKPYNFAFKSGTKDTSEYNWSYLPTYNLCPPFVKIGSFSNKKYKEAKYTNFIRANVGKGYIYWHTNPLLFTNLYLSKNNEAGFEYLNNVLSHFKAKTWIWDKVSTKPDYGKMEKPEKRFDKPKTPLEFIFSEPALTWAWILLLILAFLYALFGAKRRQQNIPVIEDNRNTSLEFVNTIGRLYFQQQNHKVIFEKLMQLFRAHLRRRYNIFIRDEEMNNEIIIAQIVKRTDVEKKIINDIFNEYLQLKGKLTNIQVEMSAETLNKFFQLIDRFFKAEESRKMINK
jgi:hypothetical protein